MTHAPPCELAPPGLRYLLPRAALTIAILWLTLIPAVASAARLFAASPFFDTGYNPRAVAVGDLDGDQKPDLVTANRWAQSLSVLRGNGDGTFWGRVDLGVGANPSAVAIGDLNADGNPDLVAANNGSNTISVLLGYGNGSFQGQMTHPTGTAPRFVAVGYLNGDGILDLVTANFGANTISVFVGIGDGTFLPRTDYATGTGPFCVGIRDLDADGHADVVAANQTANTLSVLLGIGDGTLGTKVDYSTGDLPTSLAIEDLNADGHPDVVVANQNSYTVSVLLGSGTGTLGPKTDFATGAKHPFAVAIGHLNADANLDLAVGTDGAALAVLLGNGDGTFGTAMEQETGSSPLSLAMADLNLDGFTDLVSANFNSDAVSVLLRNANGTFVTRAQYPTGPSPNSIAVADVTDDGHPDLVTANSGSNTVSVRPGIGNGTFEPRTDLVVGSSPMHVAIEDLDGDGARDLAVATFGSNTVSVLLASESGGFGPPIGYPTGTGPRFVAVADLNGDMVKDLAVANFISGSVSVLLGKGDGTFAPRTDIVTGSPYTHSISIVTGDFNGDGDIDLTVENYIDGWYCGSREQPKITEYDVPTVVLLGNGDGTFGLPVPYDGNWAPYSESVAGGNLNGDANPDLAVTGYFPPPGSLPDCLPYSLVSVLLGNADGTFAWSLSLGSAGDPSSVAIGDLNGDGHGDLVAANAFDDENEADAMTVSVWLGTGSGPFTTRTDYGAGTRPVCVAISDLNGDGRADLVTADQTSNSVSVLLNLGGTTAVGDAATPTVALLGISPNPAVGALHVSFSLTEAGPAELALYDVAGRKVASREVGHLGVGRHTITLSREGLTAGVYFLRLTRGTTKLTARAVLVR